ncbi:MAG: cytosine permease [Actinobacteria bacterium]|nr:cytosine permease [Actinomycetota bacterium]
MAAEKNVHMTGIGEAARSKVPMNRRLGFWTNSAVLAGFVIVISSLLVGGIVGANFPPRQAVWLILFAALSNSFVAIFICGIAARTGYSSALIYRFAYGSKGSILPNLVMALTGVGWFAVIVNITRDAFVDLVGIPVDSIGNWISMVVISALFVVPAYKSIRWIGYVSWVAVPALLVVLVVVLWKTVGDAGGVSPLFALTKGSGMGILTGMTIAAGGWLQGATVSADFARFFKNARASTGGVLLTFGVLVFIQFAGGAFGAAVTGEWNIFLIVSSFGLVSVTFIALFLGAWSTGQAIMYGASLQTAAPPIPMWKDQETTRRAAVIILWVAAVVAGSLGIETVMNWWLTLLATVIAPIATTVILDYWAFPSRQKMYESGRSPDTLVNPAALVTWIVGFLVGYYSGKQNFGVAVINGMIASAIVYYPWMYLTVSRSQRAEQTLQGRQETKAVVLEGGQSE